MIVKTVGRDRGNNIVVDDVKVSRTHLQIVKDDNGNVSVVDLGSMNGTFVNGKLISGEVHIKEGDEVRIGDTVLAWQNFFLSAPGLDDHTKDSESAESVSPKKKSPWKWIIAIVIVFLLAGGAMLYVNDQKKSIEASAEKEKREQMAKLEQEAIKAKEEAEEAALEYEKALRVAAVTKSKEDSERADSLGRVARTKADQVTKLNSQINDLNKQISSLKIEKAEAESRAANAEKQRIEADNKAKTAKQQADAAQKQANAADEQSRELQKKLDEEQNKTQKDAEKLKQMNDELEKLKSEKAAAEAEAKAAKEAEAKAIEAKEKAEQEAQKYKEKAARKTQKKETKNSSKQDTTKTRQ